MKIEIEKDDVVLIIKTEQPHQLIVPEQEDDEEVPDNVLLATGLLVKISRDPEFVNEILDWIIEDINTQEKRKEK